MKHIIFGGFDYAVRYEMDHDAVWKGVDYFVDNDPSLIGTTYLGKPIHSPETLLEENKDDILILIGSVEYHTELAFQLKDMGFEEGRHFIWAIAFTGDEQCQRLWKHIEWGDRFGNASSLEVNEKGEYSLTRLKVAARMIDFDKFDTLIDLGAANERIRSFLPKNIRYIPVDYVRYTDETILCDLNQHDFPSAGYDPGRTCILSMGIIGYIQDWQWFLRKVSENCTCFIIGHNDFARISREYRRTGWTRYNALFDHEIIRYMLNLGFELTDSVDFRLKTTCYKFEKKDVGNL